MQHRGAVTRDQRTAIESYLTALREVPWQLELMLAVAFQLIAHDQRGGGAHEAQVASMQNRILQTRVVVVLSALEFFVGLDLEAHEPRTRVCEPEEIASVQ